MSDNNKTPPPYRTWKRPEYKPSLEQRLAEARAKQHQPPLISMVDSKPKEK